MDAKVANTGGAAAKGRAKLLSPALVGDLLRLFDLAVIGIVGIGIYFLYVIQFYPDTPISRYLIILVISGRSPASFSSGLAFTPEITFSPEGSGSTGC